MKRQSPKSSTPDVGATRQISVTAILKFTKAARSGFDRQPVIKRSGVLSQTGRQTRSLLNRTGTDFHAADVIKMLPSEASPNVARQRNLKQDGHMTFLWQFKILAVKHRCQDLRPGFPALTQT
jgi:hypothetical protein